MSELGVLQGTQWCLSQHLLGGYTVQETLIPHPHTHFDYFLILLYWLVFSSSQGRKSLFLITYPPLYNQNLIQLGRISATHTSIH